MEPDEMRTVAEFASLAPSVHNTQPWRFVAEPYTLQIHLDPDRSLSYLDPGGRQALISCGAAIEFARLAIRSLGTGCTVRMLPSPNHPTLLATLTVGHREPTTPAEQRLIDAVPRRYTDRGQYGDELVPAPVLNTLRDAATARGCWLRVLDRPGDRVTAITLLTDAEAAETHDRAYQDELQSWRRSEPSHDGVPSQAFTAHGDEPWTTDVPLRDFSGQQPRLHPDGEAPPSVERDTIVLLGTNGDDRASWLRAGRALADMLLAITDAGLVSQPLGPVMDIPETRFRLRQNLGLIGHPQLMLRVGYGSGRPFTGRRAVDDVLAASATP
jgi:nitroreductase